MWLAALLELAVPDQFYQSTLHGGSGCIRSMHTAALAVAASACQVQFTGEFAVFGKDHTELTQPGNGLRCAKHHRAGGIQVAQAAGGGQASKTAANDEDVKGEGPDQSEGSPE